MRTSGLIRNISVLSVLFLCVTGCDFFRHTELCDFLRMLAGRPTSEEIESKRAAIRAVEANKRKLTAVVDSVTTVDSLLETRESFLRDSLKCEGVLSASGNRIVWSSDTETDTLACNYYVMIGAFSVKSNAESLVRKASDAGYRPAMFRLSNGLFAVALNGSEYVRDIYPVFNALKKENFCPKEAWILSGK